MLIYGSSAAPEPGTLALLALGGTLVIIKRRRK
ncbi:PEP-CTERM sorting domain-containing protein [Armatimonas sp.]|nr:PEP-CTERM sorting domain-containing protein [Armatimonas sp.]